MTVPYLSLKSSEKVQGPSGILRVGGTTWRGVWGGVHAGRGWDCHGQCGSHPGPTIYSRGTLGSWRGSDELTQVQLSAWCLVLRGHLLNVSWMLIFSLTVTSGSAFLLFPEFFHLIWSRHLLSAMCCYRTQDGSSDRFQLVLPSGSPCPPQRPQTTHPEPANT